MDNLTIKQRSYCMSRVRNKNTKLEKIICNELRRLKLKFQKQVKDLPGTPDVVFPREKLAVFIDGDFWHGYRFPSWENNLSNFWKRKISLNRRRDAKNFSKLRRRGWRVLRLWQHDIEKDHRRVVARIGLSKRNRKING